VFAQKRIRRSSVFVHAKQTWLPSVKRVALGALTFTRATLELALVRVGSVAIEAFSVGHRRFEIPVSVAVGAGHGAMFSD